MTEVTIRAMKAGDWPAVERIYAEGIASGNATFQDKPPSWEEFDGGKIRGLRLVAVDTQDNVVGWAAASSVSSRPVYQGVIEHSIYVSKNARGAGVGHLLLAEFITTSEAAGVWMIQSAVFPENRGSLALHAAHGFREVGIRERIGRMSFGPWAGQWRDNVFLERRSTVTGTN
ncbi:N-acetyltransferase (plasmid) [Frondihabitans sucicola]|uniref:N-acetyltransferase n=1 Tax=Frondihabitans sucicola TaxID=1268041 RepID=A0ABM8GVU9_9MICO|nr:GNAT family N-acetyltransferase [Frondihabitans sucicola]BDZ50503.1 N-acetyltransferase [Frondihabitans sucicola]BDZ52592.1 N-acetyltransferase [Frondihabitans sucicola]